MPWTDQFSRPAHGVMSSGSIRSRITAPLDLATWTVDTFEQMVAFLVHREDRLGLTVDQVADLEVRGLDRRAHDVADDAHPGLPDRVVELVARAADRGRAA